MACSKLFSGELPEISTQIIQNLRNDFKILYSLALVNRFWCRLAIPLLWEDPFFHYIKKDYFLNTYLTFLNGNEKNEFKKIMSFYTFDSNLPKPLFNYPSLIKTLNFTRMRFCVETWFESCLNSYYRATSTFPNPFSRTQEVEANTVE